MEIRPFRASEEQLMGVHTELALNFISVVALVTGLVENRDHEIGVDDTLAEWDFGRWSVSFAFRNDYWFWSRSGRPSCQPPTRRAGFRASGACSVR